jgi:hypothetical protein
MNGGLRASKPDAHRRVEWNYGLDALRATGKGAEGLEQFKLKDTHPETSLGGHALP